MYFVLDYYICHIFKMKQRASRINFYLLLGEYLIKYLLQFIIVITILINNLYLFSLYNYSFSM